MSALEADREKFTAAGADIFAVNPASVKAHDKYCDQKGFTFPLLSDPDKTTLKKYQALKAGGLLVQRTVYVIGPDNTIIFAEKGMPADDDILKVIKDHKKT